MGEASGMTEVGIIATDLTGELFPAAGKGGPGLRLEPRDGELFGYLVRFNRDGGIRPVIRPISSNPVKHRCVVPSGSARFIPQAMRPSRT